MVTETSLRRWLEEAAFNRRWFDVIIFAGGKQYRAHKIILSSASPFLRGILLSRSTDDFSSIVLADVSSEIVELLLQYVYTGEVSLLHDQVESFIALAKVLQLQIDKEVACKNKCNDKHLEYNTNGESRLQNLLSNDTRDYILALDKKERLKKEESSEEIRNEGTATNKDLDVEILIKSDKIEKCQMNEASKRFPLRNKDKSDIMYSDKKYPKISEFYENMQHIERTYDSSNSISDNIRNGKTVSNDTISLSLEDESRNSSCSDVVIVDHTIDKSRQDETNQMDETPLYRHPRRRGLVLSSKTLPNQNVPLNLMNNLERSIDPQNHTFDGSYNDRSTNDFKINDEGIGESQERETNLVNHRLIKPIPSLMPIDRLGYDLNIRTSPTLLDLSAARKKLNRNNNSAFQEVQRNSKHSFDSGKRNLYSNLCNYPTNNTNSLVSSVYPLQNPPLRVESYSPRNEDRRNSNSLSLTYNETAFEYSGVKNKPLPRNRVISGPWCYKSSTFYKPGRKTPSYSPQLHQDTDLQVNFKDVSNCSLQNTPTNEKSILSLSERSNDSNNNFETVNCNNVGVTQKTLYQIEHSGGHYENESCGVPSKLLSLDSPRSMVSSNIAREEDSFKTAEVDYKSIVKSRGLEGYNQSEDRNFSVVPNDLESELNVKTEFTDCEVLKCEFCSKVFTSKESLAIHAGCHSSRARYKCDQCDKCFSQLRNYKYHVSVHRGTKEFAATCNVCGKYFNDRGYLSSHMKIHRNRKEYQCPHCPKSFNQRVAYNMHVRIHTGIKPHQCEECGKAFSRKMLLKQHARTHSGEKPYACTSCGKRFADRSNMTLHMRLHSGVKPFSCTLCPKSFTKKHHLKTHLNYHTGNKPYACVKCGLTFSQSSNMRTHMKKCTLPDPKNGHEVQPNHAMQPELMAT